MKTGATGELPLEFQARIREMLGPECDRFLSALVDPEPGLRVNTLRLSPGEFLDMTPFEISPLAFPAEGFIVERTARPGRHPFHDAGLYYLQDPGAMVVGAMVDPRPGELVLDLAAAPGGKASHLAARMRGRGVLVANDVHVGRARELASNLERLGVRNAIVTAEAPERLAEALGPVCDRVLLDAPCSGESMFHKSAAAISAWSPASVAGCARRQGDVLEQAARLVRPGGLLVYSTCTFSPEENEEVIARFLASHRAFTVTRLSEPAGALPGQAGWVADPALRRDDLSLTVRLWPHRVPGAGHFVAALRRDGEEARPEAHQSAAGDHPAEQGGSRTRRSGVGTGRGPIDAAAVALTAWSEFRERSLPLAEVEHGADLVTRGDGLYAVPSAAPDLAGLRVLVPGLWLGDLRKGRFDPAHSLALALRREEIATSVSLDADSDEVSAYLRGETLRSEGEDGWVVVTVGGFPLGWGKRVAGVVKNHYPKGLRRR